MLTRQLNEMDTSIIISDIASAKLNTKVKNSFQSLIDCFTAKKLHINLIKAVRCSNKNVGMAAATLIFAVCFSSFWSTRNNSHQSQSRLIYRNVIV